MSPYDHDGERVDPRDVLDREELADYERSLRNRGRTFHPPTPRQEWRDDPFLREEIADKIEERR